MLADVGGRLEVVPHRRSLFAKDYWRISVLLLVAGAIHAWLVLHTAIPARDSMGFAHRQQFVLPQRRTNHRSTPPATSTSSATLRPAWLSPRGLAHGEGPSIVGLFTSREGSAGHADRQCDRRHAARHSALSHRPHSVRPKCRLRGRAAIPGLTRPARVTSDGLSEGVYLLVMATAILLGVRRLDDRESAGSCSADWRLAELPGPPRRASGRARHRRRDSAGVGHETLGPGRCARSTHGSRGRRRVVAGPYVILIGGAQ